MTFDPGLIWLWPLQALHGLTFTAAHLGVMAFVQAAARLLKPSGHLWMVANRHLPYEATLTGQFAKTTEVGGDARFKILRAERPSRQRR